ncbi:MAG: putative inorganic carbon transporter subunit DabA, partial [Saprospiraceae bacterium]
MTNTLEGFDLEAVIHHLKHYLPSQTPLKDFIHHNSLHAFQEMPFYEAIFTSSAIFGHQATFSITEYRNLYAAGRIRPEILEKVTIDRKGVRDAKIWLDKALYEVQEYWMPPRIGRLRAYWKEAYKTDLDIVVQPLLFRVLCSYLDQGIALWHFPFVENGLIPGLRNMEKNGLSSFFKTRRARRLLFDEQASVETLLELLVGDAVLYEQYLFDQQFSHRGWSGMVAAIEDRPDTILYPKKIALRELIFFELLLELDALDAELGEDWMPLAQIRPIKPTDLFEPIELTAWHEALMIWQDAFEWSYYDEVLSGLKLARAADREETPGEKSFQAVFCIDERECSIRRHIESVDPRCETLGAPGFFGVEFFFHPANSKFYEKLCPAPVTPRYLIKEKESVAKRKHELLHTKKSHTFFRG